MLLQFDDQLCRTSTGECRLVDPALYFKSTNTKAHLVDYVGLIGGSYTACGEEQLNLLMYFSHSINASYEAVTT